MPTETTENMPERFAYLFGALFQLAEMGQPDAERILRAYRNHFDFAKCNGVLIIKGEHFDCDLAMGHADLAHANKALGAIWGTSDLASAPLASAS